jgi:hypothetical protein
MMIVDPHHVAVGARCHSYTCAGESLLTSRTWMRALFATASSHLHEMAVHQSDIATAHHHVLMFFYHCCIA